MDYGTLRVTTPDGQVREYPIDVPVAFVGRAEGNRVVIDHVTVSRRHARLAIDDGRLMVEDLGSATGTFVGSQRITSHAPNLVKEGESIRFGDAEAHFIPAAPEEPAPEPAPPTTTPVVPGTPSTTTVETSTTVAPQPPPSPTPVEPPPPPQPQPRGGATWGGAAQPISVSIKSPTAPVAAGSPTTATVVLQNRGTIVDEFSLSVPDLPAEWVRISRAKLPLLPGARDEVTIVIHPPRSPESRAGEHPFAVAVVSRDLGVEVRALGRFSIQPFDGFQMELRPVRAKKDFKVVTRNTGNAPGTYALGGTDDENGLKYRFETETVELQPGEERAVGVRIGAKKRRWFGKEETKPFRVEAKPAAAGAQKQTVDGQLRSRATLEAWKWLFVVALLGGLLAGGAWGYTKTCRGGWPLCGEESTSPEPTTQTPTVPGATATPKPEDTPPAGLRPGGMAVVANSQSGAAGAAGCLKVRSAADISSDANVLGTLCNGAEVTILDGPVNVATFIFWKIRTAEGVEGWAAEGDTGDGPRWLVPK